MKVQRSDLVKHPIKSRNQTEIVLFTESIYIN